MTTSAWRVLVSAPYLVSEIDQFYDFFKDNRIEADCARVVERLEEEELLSVIARYDGIICGDDRITAKVVDTASRLKVIAKWGTGIDSIDVDAATRKGIRVCRTPDAFTKPVADTVLGYILAFARNLNSMDKEMREGVWRKKPGTALFECTIGVIGVGAIGCAVLERAYPFGATLLGHDPKSPNLEFIQNLGVEMVELDELLARSDFISVNCDLNPTSRHLLSAPQFAHMKPTAVLINTARGPIVNEEALTTALEKGLIGGAALDVFEEEPLPESSRLRTIPTTMLAPHNCNSSPTAWNRVHWSTLKQLLAGLNDG